MTTIKLFWRGSRNKTQRFGIFLCTYILKRDHYNNNNDGNISEPKTDALIEQARSSAKHTQLHTHVYLLHFCSNVWLRKYRRTDDLQNTPTKISQLLKTISSKRFSFDKIASIFSVSMWTSLLLMCCFCYIFFFLLC